MTLYPRPRVSYCVGWEELERAKGLEPSTPTSFQSCSKPRQANILYMLRTAPLFGP